MLAGQFAAVLSMTRPLAGFVSCKKHPNVSRCIFQFGIDGLVLASHCSSGLWLVPSMNKLAVYRVRRQCDASKAPGDIAPFVDDGFDDCRDLRESLFGHHTFLGATARRRALLIAHTMQAGVLG